MTRTRKYDGPKRYEERARTRARKRRQRLLTIRVGGEWRTVKGRRGAR